MQPRRWSIAAAACVAIGVLAGATYSTSARGADPMETTDPQTWTKVITDRDIESQIALQSELIKKDVRTSATFRRSFRKLERSGNAVAMLGNVIVLTSSDDETKKKGAALREAGLEFAKACEEKEFDAAKKAAAVIDSFPKTIKPAANAEPVPFATVMPMEPLMKWVATIDAATRKGTMESAEFRKNSKELAVDSQFLACLAIVARDHNEGANWKEWCDAMRDNSLEMANQFGSKNQSAASEAWKANQKSCASCHHAFRDQDI